MRILYYTFPYYTNFGVPSGELDLEASKSNYIPKSL